MTETAKEAKTTANATEETSTKKHEEKKTQPTKIANTRNRGRLAREEKLSNHTPLI